MTLTTARALDAITKHSVGFAAAAAGNLDAAVEHCPEWNVADLVWHLTEVHWFWRTIAGERLAGPPDEARRPDRPAPEMLLDTFRAGAQALVETLKGSAQSAPCWTWYPPQQDIAFITRHQVQEAAVHHWDAEHAAGHTVSIEADIAADSIEEFVTVSLADADDVAGLGRALDGDLVLHATDVGTSWTVHQKSPDAALTWMAGGDTPTVAGSASDVLLWLYRRVQLEVADPDLVARFRQLSSS